MAAKHPILGTVIPTRNARTAIEQPRYVDHFDGVVTDFRVCDNGAVDLFGDGYDLPIHIPAGHPWEFQPRVGQHILAYWENYVYTDADGLRKRGRGVVSMLVQDVEAEAE